MTYSYCVDCPLPCKSTTGTASSKKKLLTSLFSGFRMEHFYKAQIIMELFHSVKIINQEV